MKKFITIILLSIITICSYAQPSISFIKNSLTSHVINPKYKVVEVTYYDKLDREELIDAYNRHLKIFQAIELKNMVKCIQVLIDDAKKIDFSPLYYFNTVCEYKETPNSKPQYLESKIICTDTKILGETADFHKIIPEQYLSIYHKLGIINAIEEDLGLDL